MSLILKQTHFNIIKIQMCLTTHGTLALSRSLIGSIFMYLLHFSVACKIMKHLITCGSLDLCKLGVTPSNRGGH